MQFGNTELQLAVLEISSVTVRMSATLEMANYVKNIVDGPRPGDMPIRNLSQHELVVNSQTTHKLAYRCRPDLRSKAVQVIQ
jgi:putative tryptophan/tyrosine transport system substrate-binding protein